MPFVPDQLVIQLGECAAIGQRGEAEGKGRPIYFHGRVSIIPESAKQPKANCDGSADPNNQNPRCSNATANSCFSAGARKATTSAITPKMTKPPR